MPTDSTYVQFGCGLCAPESWTNFDASPSLRTQRIPLIGRLIARNRPKFPANVRYGDIVRGLPLPDGRCAGVFGSHVLEHLSLADMRTALANSHRLLRNGGILRIIVPDLEAGARWYLDAVKQKPTEAAITFIRNLQMGDEHRPRGTIGRIRNALSNSRHRWMWDYAGMAHELQQAGFRQIRRCSFGDCDDPRFRDVEDPVRFEHSVGVECRR